MNLAQPVGTATPPFETMMNGSEGSKDGHEFPVVADDCTTTRETEPGFVCSFRKVIALSITATNIRVVATIGGRGNPRWGALFTSYDL